jgi:hypothetical protein
MLSFIQGVKLMSVIPQKCPSCAAPLKVTQLTCIACGTGVVGSFELSPFVRLSMKSLHFLEVFIRNRGNVKEMARETGESYWVIRRRLDEVIEEMGFDTDLSSEQDLAASRQEILQRLRKGEINVAEAKKLLTKLGE